jgi:four helix bundle protein
MNKIVAFTDLHVWQEGHKLVIGVYENTKKFPKEETYSMINQMRRAASSVTANIAEGFGRHTYPDKINFYYMAQGSLTELKNFLLIAKDINYLNTNDFNVLMEQANVTHQLLQGFIKKSKTFINHESKIINRV